MSAPIKFSFAGAKTNPKAKNLLKPSHNQNGQPPAKKARLLGDDEPEEKETSVAISGWDANGGGAVEIGQPKEEPKVLVIPTLPNRNWMGYKDRKDNVKSETPVKKEEVDEQEPGVPTHYGLQIIKKEPQTEENGDTVMTDAPTVKSEPQDDGLTEDQRLEKRAVEALLHGRPSASETHIIPAQTEDEAFSHDYTTAPDPPSLDAYESVPIEGFGAAMLRGMGWKDGEELGRKKGQKPKPREVKRRPAGLGIGAKVENAVDLEMAEWGRAKGGKVPTYNPVVLENKKTGEKITEEELKKKLERQKLIAEEAEKEPAKEKDREGKRDKYDDYEDEDERRERKRKEKERERRDRDRSPARDDRRRDRDRDRRRDDDYDSRDSRERRDKRDRSRDRDRDSGRKDRRRDDDYYSDKKRDSRRDYSDDERRREKRRDRDSGRDRRDRSRSPRRHRDDDYRKR